MTVQQAKNFRHNIRVLAFVKGFSTEHLCVASGIPLYKEGSTNNRVAAIISRGIQNFTLAEAKSISKVLGYDHHDMLNKVVRFGFTDDLGQIAEVKLRTGLKRKKPKNE